MKFTSRDLSLKRTPSKKQSGVFGVKISVVTKWVKSQALQLTCFLKAFYWIYYEWFICALFLLFKIESKLNCKWTGCHNKDKIIYCYISFSMILNIQDILHKNTTSLWWLSLNVQQYLSQFLSVFLHHVQYLDFAVVVPQARTLQGALHCAAVHWGGGEERDWWSGHLQDLWSGHRHPGPQSCVWR